MTDLAGKDNPIPLGKEDQNFDVSPAIQELFKSFIERYEVFQTPAQRDYIGHQYKIEPDSLFMAERAHTVVIEPASEHKKFDKWIARKHFIQEGDNFELGGEIGFSETPDGTYAISTIDKLSEGGEDIRFDFDRFNSDELGITIESSSMYIWIGITDNRLAYIKSYLVEGGEGIDIDFELKELIQGPKKLETQGDVFETEYDPVTNTVRFIIAKDSQIKRVLRVPVDISVKEVAAKSFSEASLDNPYDAPVTDDYTWLHVDLKELVGIKDETIGFGQLK